MRTRAWRRVQRKRIQRNAIHTFPGHDKEWLLRVAEHFTRKSYYQDTRAYLGPTRQERAADLRHQEQLEPMPPETDPYYMTQDERYKRQYWDDVANGLFDEYDAYDNYLPSDEPEPYEPYYDPNYGYDPWEDFGTWDFSPKRKDVDFFYYGGTYYDGPLPADLRRTDDDKHRRWWDFVYAPPGYLSTEDYFTAEDRTESYTDYNPEYAALNIDPFYPDPTPNHPDADYGWSLV